MKQVFLFLTALLCSFTFLTLPAYGQRKPIPFQIVAYKSIEDPLGYKNLPIDVIVMIKDHLGNVLYSETHRDTLNAIAETKINIGTGENPSVTFDTLGLGKAKWLCNTVTVHDPAGDVVIMTEDPFGQNVFSAEAENTNAMGNVLWTQNSVPPTDLYMPPPDITFSIPVVRYDPSAQGVNSFEQLIMDNYFSMVNKPSAVNAMPLDYLHIGTGNPCPLVFGRNSIDALENFYTIYPGPLAKYYNAFGIKVPQEAEQYGHPTAAVYAENIYDGLGVGMYANGYSRGSYNAGRTGAIGICNNTTGNGAGLWGYVLNAAATGNANYGVLGSSNQLANSYAGFFDGDVLVTGEVMQGSDRMLKTNIQASTFGLSALLKLSPMTYEFAPNSAYSLPKGEQIGFIAQEVEEVIPAIVSDMIVPNSLDPDQMDDSGTTTIKGINYTALIPVMTKAIQELNAKVEALTAEVDRLKKGLEACQPKK